MFNGVRTASWATFWLTRPVDCGYAKIRKDGKSIRATSFRKLNSFEDKIIIQWFSNIIKRLTSYYSLANKVSDLWQVIAIYRKSCALTLADKHKLKRAAVVYKKYGFNLKVRDSVKQKWIVLFYPTALKTIVNFKLRKTNLSLSK